MDNKIDEGNELHLIRSQMESLAKQQKSQLEVFEKISGDLRDIRVAMVFIVIISLLALVLYAFRSGIL